MQFREDYLEFSAIKKVYKNKIGTYEKDCPLFFYWDSSFTLAQQIKSNPPNIVTWKKESTAWCSPILTAAKAAGIDIAVYKNNEPLLHKGYGMADLEFDVKMPVDASFEIGSVTKQFTAAAICQLAEAGKLSLDDDITKYIKFDTHGKKVTIRNLLSHTSGIKGYTELPVFEKLSMFSYKRDTLLRLLEKEPFDFEPGGCINLQQYRLFHAGTDH